MRPFTPAAGAAFAEAIRKLGPNRKLLTVRQFAASLNAVFGENAIGKQFIYRQLSSGEIPAFRFGSRWKIPATYVDEFILKAMKGDAS